MGWFFHGFQTGKKRFFRQGWVFYQGFGPTMDHDSLSELDFCGHFEQDVGRLSEPKNKIKISKSKTKTEDT